MNTKFICYVISNLLKILALMFLLPLAVAFYYGEGLKIYFSFIIPLLIILIFSKILSRKIPEEQDFYSKEAFIIVSVSWLLISFFGALPFYISDQIPRLMDSFFESVSGFTTTGATILKDVEILSNSMLFWRSFTHFVGGMGVLVLVLAILPKGNSKALHLMRAEVPGPKVGKLVAKISYNSRILYFIYLGMTCILIVFLMLGNMNFFDACIHAFGAAGTGGFSSKNLSVAYYNSPYIEYVLGIAMIIFGINFNLFYLLLLGNIKQVLSSEEAKYYLLIIFISTLGICFNLYPRYNSTANLIRDSFFAVSSIITTTGYTTVDFGKWPIFSQTILLFLMFSGACAGSTAGGLKISRIIIIFKKIVAEFKKIGHPNKVTPIKFEGKVVDKETLNGVSSYFLIYFICFSILLLITSLDCDNFMSAFSSVASTFNNIGPGLPTSNFFDFSLFTKFCLSIGMLLGRLEILPMLILISPSIYKKVE